MKPFTLEVLPRKYAICRLDAEAEVPRWATGAIVSITRTGEELSVVCREDGVPPQVVTETGWRCLKVLGPLEFSMTGVIASLTRVLAKAEVSVFVISTFDTDYILVKDAAVDSAVESLVAAGHEVVRVVNRTT